MTSRGFLIRFIDIGLILLFGFVMISDIESLSQVELSPESSAQEAEPAPPPSPATSPLRSATSSLATAPSSTSISSSATSP